MKTITHPTSGKAYKFGRNRPTSPSYKSSFRDMLKSGTLPYVNPGSLLATHYADLANQSLSDTYGNDFMGDCVEASGFHIRGIHSYNSGNGVWFNPTQVVQAYSDMTGYDPSKTDANGNNPTDNGTDENFAINWWETKGYPDGVKLLNAVSVDPTNKEEVQLAIFLFENLMFGVELPDGWINPPPETPGFEWDVAGPPVDSNGHAFCGVDLYPNGVKICTWGMLGYITFDAIAYYAASQQNGQLFCLINPDIVNRITQKSPIGYDITALSQYIKNL